VVFEKVNIPQATVLPVFAGNFKRYSNDLTVALTAQITTLWARAETLDLNSNIQDKVIKTAYIADLAVGTAQIDALSVTSAKIALLAVGTAQIDALAVTDAKINTLSVGKLTAGTITSQSITLALIGGTGDVCIKGGKTDFGDNTAGMIFGMDDSDSDRMKFEVGDANTYVKWDGLTLSIKGSITVTAGSVPNANVTGLGALATLNNVTCGGSTVSGFGALAALSNVTYGGSTVSGFGALAALGSVAASNCDTTIISGGKIITGLLTADNIQAGTILVARFATNLAYITNTAQIANAVISTANIGNLQVTSATIADLTVGGAKITDFSATRGATAIPSDLTSLADYVSETAISGASVTVNCSTDNDTIRGVFKVQVTPPIYYSDKASTVQATVTIRVRKTNISGTIVGQSVLQAVGTVSAQTTTSLNCFFVHAPGATGDVTFIATYEINDLTSTTYTGSLRSMKMDVWRRSK